MLSKINDNVVKLGKRKEKRGYQFTKNDIQNIKQQLTPLQTKVKTLENDANKLIDEVNSYEKELTPEKPSETVPTKI